MRWRVFDDMSLCVAADVERMLPLVSAERRRKALNYKHVFGQWTCLKACEMLGELLTDMGLWSGGTLPDFEYNEYGKPLLAGMPDFSISHCKDAVAVAVCEQSEETAAGVDVESVREVREGLVERVMNEREQAQIRSAGNEAEEFMRLWTRKEAVLKCMGTGIRSDLTEVLEGVKLPELTTWTGGEGRYVVSVARICG